MHPLSVAFDREQTIHDHEREENARVPIIKFTILVTKCLSFLTHASAWIIQSVSSKYSMVVMIFQVDESLIDASDKYRQ